MRVVFAISTFLLLLSLNSFAQLNIKGMVIDSTTKQPLQFANIYIPETSIGLSSNVYGEFSFHIPENFRDNTLNISFMGYKKKQIEISSIKADSFYVFELIPDLYKIGDVFIMDPNMGSASHMVKVAIKRISKNYPRNRFLLHGYYRDYISDVTTNEYENLIEAAILIEDRGFNTDDYYYSKIQLEQLRFNPGYSIDNNLKATYKGGVKRIPYTPYQQSNELVILRGQDPIRNLIPNSSFIRVFDIDFVKDYNFEYNTVIENEGVKIIEIGFTAHPKVISEDNPDFTVQGKIYIEKESLAILKIIYTVYAKLINYSGKFLEIRMEYKKYLDKYYLNYLSVCNYFELYNFPDTTLPYFQFRELFINQIETKSFKRINFSDELRKDIPLFRNYIPVAEENFWDNYNYPSMLKISN